MRKGNHQATASTFFSLQNKDLLRKILFYFYLYCSLEEASFPPRLPLRLNKSSISFVAGQSSYIDRILMMWKTAC